MKLCSGHQPCEVCGQPGLHVMHIPEMSTAEIEQIRESYLAVADNLPMVMITGEIKLEELDDDRLAEIGLMRAPDPAYDAAIKVGEDTHLLTVGSPNRTALRVTMGSLDRHGRFHRCRPDAFVIWRGKRRDADDLASALDSRFRDWADRRRASRWRETKGDPR